MVYRQLDRRRKLESVKAFIARWRPMALKALVVLVVLGGGVVYSRYVDVPSLNRGVPERLKWHIKDLDGKFSQSRYYFIQSFIDSEYLWQARVVPQKIDEIMTALELSKTSEIPAEFYIKPPKWWPAPAAEVIAYSSRNFPSRTRGGDGWHAFAVYDPQDERLSVWIKDNF